MMVSPMQKTSLSVRRLWKDRSGLAAVEFAMIFPMMVVMFFGVLELSAAISWIARPPWWRERFRSDISDGERGEC
jgi:Flp pilus assembly pilin Flp